MGLLLLAGCHPTPQTPSHVVLTTPATTRAVAVQSFSAAGLTLSYPAGWTSAPQGKSVFHAVAPTSSAALTLDVPTLPWHPPGFLPIGQIRSGYVDDVKKRMPDATVTDVDVSVPSAAARRVKLSGHVNGNAAIDESVLMVHNDRVYILSADSDPASYPAAQAALDAAVGSIQWQK